MQSNHQHRLIGWLGSLYRLLLFAYPAGFRQSFGREMAVAFSTQAREQVRHGGTWALVPFAFRTLGDWLKTVVKENADLTEQTTPLFAAAQVILIGPAAVFIGAVLLRSVPPLHAGAQRIVLMYAGRVWTLCLLLLMLPFGVLAAGFAAMAHRWRDTGALQGRRRVAAMFPDLCAVIVATTTFLAAVILTVVVLHMLAT